MNKDSCCSSLVKWGRRRGVGSWNWGRKGRGKRTGKRFKWIERKGKKRGGREDWGDEKEGKTWKGEWKWKKIGRKTREGGKERKWENVKEINSKIWKSREDT